MQGTPARAHELLGAIMLVVCGTLAASALAGTRQSCFQLVPAARSEYSDDQFALIEKLNRRDRKHLAALDTLVVPCDWTASELDYSPLPREYAQVAHHPKAIVVDKEWQAFGAYELGILVRWGPVSSGRRTMRTPEGLFHLTWRSRGRRSTIDPDWYMRWYFNFHNRRGLSFHQYALPGRPASHACIRLIERDARWLYHWGESWRIDDTGRRVLDHGTPVIIVERFDFSARPPWRIPSALASGVELPARIPVE
jgi:hypothetical protein